MHYSDRAEVRKMIEDDKDPFGAFIVALVITAAFVFLCWKIDKAESQIKALTEEIQQLKKDR